MAVALQRGYCPGIGRTYNGYHSYHAVSLDKVPYVAGLKNIPDVTTTLNRPLTIRSTTRSSSSSFVFALFNAQ